MCDDDDDARAIAIGTNAKTLLCETVPISDELMKTP